MVTLLDVSAMAGHHAMPAALLFIFVTSLERQKVSVHISDLFNSLNLLDYYEYKNYINIVYFLQQAFQPNSNKKLSVHFWLT